MDQFTKHHVTIGLIGYLIGIATMTTVATTEIQRAQRREKRALELTKGLVEVSWPHLPSESKLRFNTEIEFFNILVQEDL